MDPQGVHREGGWDCCAARDDTGGHGTGRRGCPALLCQGSRRADRHPPGHPVTAAGAAGAGLLGLLVGALVNRAAGRYPWPAPVTLAGVLGRGVHAVRRPVLEVATAALFVLVVLRFGTSAELPAWLWFVSAGLLLSVIDLRLRLLPNRVVLPATAGALVLLTAAAVVDGEWAALLRAVLAGAAAFGVGLGMAVLAPTGLGMGDVKLAGFLGVLLGWLGWHVVLLGFFLGFLVQAVLGLALMTAGRAGRRTELPFGPALAGGALVAAVWVGDVADLLPGGT